MSTRPDPRPRWRRLASGAVRPVRTGATSALSRVRPGCIVLMYHHVADVHHDPWQLAVAPRHFAEHLEVLRASGRPLLRLDELEAALVADRVPRRAVAVTFDDGYADNALVALPALERADVPATVFVTTGAIDAPREMWWDELERTILAAPVLPAALELDVGGVRVARPVTGATPAPGWRAATEAPTSTREALYHDLWARLTPLRADDQRAVLDHLAAWAAVDLTPRPTHRMATTEELERLVRSPLVEIGSHTATHPSLPGCAALEAELACSKGELEARCHGPVWSFAYPSGHHDDRTVAAVGAAGYRSAVTVRGGVVRREDDPFRLPRIAVGDVDGDGFARLLARRG